MLSRTRSILVECKEVWPLASRWLDSLDKFFRDPQAVAPITEGSMADGKDAVPQLLRHIPSPSPVPQSEDMSFSSSTYSHPTPFSHHQEPPQQPQTHPGSFSHPQHSLALQHECHLLHSQPHAHQQPQGTMYFSRTHAQISSQSVDCMGMPIEVFDQPPVAAADPVPYDMSTATALAVVSTAVPYYTAPLGPNTDGFEDELQYYCEGTDWGGRKA